MHQVKTRCGTLGERAPLQAPEHQPLLPSCPGTGRRSNSCAMAREGRSPQVAPSGFPNGACISLFGFPFHFMHKSKVDIGESSS